MPDPTAIIGRDTDHYDWPELLEQLNKLLRLRATPIGMKLFASAAELDEIERLRRPSNIHTTCLLYTSPSPRDKRQSRMPSSA